MRDILLQISFPPSTHSNLFDKVRLLYLKKKNYNKQQKKKPFRNRKPNFFTEESINLISLIFW